MIGVVLLFFGRVMFIVVDEFKKVGKEIRFDYLGVCFG